MATPRKWFQTSLSRVNARSSIFSEGKKVGNLTKFIKPRVETTVKNTDSKNKTDFGTQEVV